MPPPWRIRDYAWGIRDHLWEYEIVERIRQTGAIDASSFSDVIAGEYPLAPAGWEAAERHAAKANRLHAAYLDDASIAKRAAKRELLRQGMEEVKAAWKAFEEGKGPRPTWGDPYVEEKRQAQRKADAKVRAIKEAARAARQAEEQTKWKAWEEERAQRAAERAARQGKEKAELDRMLTTMRGRAPDVAGFQAEERRILDSKWSCTVCGGKSTIERKSPGYQLTCLECGKSAWGSHKALWEVLSK